MRTHDPQTRLIHAGQERDQYHGASSVPIFQTSTFHQTDPEHFGPYDYARSGNPTRTALETAIAELEGGEHGFAFASGMAAMSAVLLTFASGDHLVVGQDIYGGTYRALTTVLRRWGLEATFVDSTDDAQLRAALTPRTRAILVETPSNPTLRITDLATVAALAHEHGLLAITDNTFMSPVLQRPIALGFDVVVHSATKFIAGHSDVIAGLVVVADAAFARRLRQVQNALGAILGPQDAWLVLRGLRTLGVRLARGQESAAHLARWLAAHPLVRRVYYPGLAAHSGHEQHRRQSDGDGAVLSFDLGSRALAVGFLKRVTVPLVAVSLGGVESILSYPATMSHAAMPAELRAAHGIGDGLIRLSVGLEQVEDLCADLDQALHAAANSHEEE